MNATMKRIVHRLPVTQARINLGQVVRRVHVNKEQFILEKDGIPMAAIMDVDEYRRYMEQRDPRALQDMPAMTSLGNTKAKRQQPSKRRSK